MSLFAKPETGAAFLKMGLLGFAKSGKTHTACLVAIGIAKAAIKKGMPYANRPVYFIDSDGGSDYIHELFEEAGVELLVAKTRAFSDLCTAVKEAEANACALIIDSITHFWQEFQATFEQAKNRRNGLVFGDWAELKQQWRREFTDPYLNSNIHIIMCGRAAHEFEDTVDERGKKGIEKSGVKMSAEKDLGFEPALLVHMIRDTDSKTGKIVRSAHVMGDRFRALDGKDLPQPSFKSFVPHIEKLNWGGEQNAVNTTRTSEDMIQPDDWSAHDRKTDRGIVLDLIKNLLSKHFGTSRDDKTKANELKEKVFGSNSDVFLEKRCRLEDLQAGYDQMYQELEGKPSPFSALSGDADETLPVDEIPYLNEDRVTH